VNGDDAAPPNAVPEKAAEEEDAPDPKLNGAAPAPEVPGPVIVEPDTPPNWGLVMPPPGAPKEAPAPKPPNYDNQYMFFKRKTQYDINIQEQLYRIRLRFHERTT
jgi:hypothetical protein